MDKLLEYLFLYGIKASYALVLFLQTHLLCFYLTFWLSLNIMAEHDTQFSNTRDSPSVFSSYLDHSLFLHRLDHHGLLLVSKRLNGDNYQLLAS